MREKHPFQLSSYKSNRKIITETTNCEYCYNINKTITIKNNKTKKNEKQKTKMKPAFATIMLQFCVQQRKLSQILNPLYAFSIFYRQFGQTNKQTNELAKQKTKQKTKNKKTTNLTSSF